MQRLAEIPAFVIPNASECACRRDIVLPPERASKTVLLAPKGSLLTAGLTTGPQVQGEFNITEFFLQTPSFLHVNIRQEAEGNTELG